MPIAIGPWSRIVHHADRLGVSGDEMLDLVLDLFDEHGEAWMDAQRWYLDLAPEESRES